METLHLLCIATLGGLLIAVAVGDIRAFVIPNRLCAAVALLALPFWFTSGAPLWPLLAWQVGLAVAVFAVFAALFALGAMGGGDVKLLAALALWLAPIRLAETMMLIAMAGGLLTLALLLRHRLRRAGGRPEIPYGVAIAVGAFVTIGEPIVNRLVG